MRRIISECGRILVFRKITDHFTRQTRFGQILPIFFFQKLTGSATSEIFAPHEFSNTDYPAAREPDEVHGEVECNALILVSLFLVSFCFVHV
jgi:hypothetical protein